MHTNIGDNMYYLNCFFIYSILGHLIETIIALITGNGFKSGFLYGWWTPVYGMGAVTILFVSEYLFKTIIVIEISKEQQIKNLENRNDDINSSINLNKDYEIKKYQDKIKIVKADGNFNNLYAQIDEIIKSIQANFIDWNSFFDF